MLEFQPLQPEIRCEVGECPVYDERQNVLWFVDIVGRALHNIDLNNGAAKSWSFSSEACSFGLAESGRVVLALRDVVGLFDPSSGSFQELAVIERDLPDTRLNDGKVGPDGAFWVGSADLGDQPIKRPIGSLYRVDGQGRAERKVEGLIASNGLAFSPDGRTMFHSDSRGYWLDRWSLDPLTGTISDRTRIATFSDGIGRPDGAAVDAQGCYWSAGVSAGRLNRFSPEGKLVEIFSVPLAAPTMPCFGGPKFNTLFLTSLRFERSAKLVASYPLSGLTLTAESPVMGLPAYRFRDL